MLELVAVHMSTVVTENDRVILENIGEEVIASRMKRLEGFLITRAVYAFFILVPAHVVSRFGGDYTAVMVALALASVVIHVSLLAFRQQTPGMMIVDTKIISDGTAGLSIPRLVLWRLVLNWVVLLLPGIKYLVIFNYLNMTGNATNRCVHDEMSRTVVVEARRGAPNGGVE